MCAVGLAPGDFSKRLAGGKALMGGGPAPTYKPTADAVEKDRLMRLGMSPPVTNPALKLPGWG